MAEASGERASMPIYDSCGTFNDEDSYTQTVYGKERSAARHTGHDGPQDVDARNAPRICHRSTSAAAIRGRSAGGGRVALSRSPASGTQRVDRRRVGAVLQEPPGALLQTHSRTAARHSLSETARYRQMTRRHRARDGDGMMLRRLARRLRYWLHSGERARLLREEMEVHLEMKTQDLMEDGMTEPDARGAARRQFGNLTMTAGRRAGNVDRTLVERSHTGHGLRGAHGPQATRLRRSRRAFSRAGDRRLFDDLRHCELCAVPPAARRAIRPA